MDLVIESEVDAARQNREPCSIKADTKAPTRTQDDNNDSSNNLMEETNLMINLFQMDLDEILQKIFLCLSPRSLHSCRQVCPDWNNFIQRRVWNSPLGREQMLKKLESQWRHGEPRETVVCHGRHPSYLAGDEQVLVCGFENGRADVYRLDRWQMEEDQVEDAVLESYSRSLDRAVQLHVGGEVIVTVDGGGMVAVWTKNDFTQIYQSCHHGIDTKVLGVKVVKNLILTGGNDGNIALLKYEGGQVNMMKKMTDNTRESINHLDSDGTWALTGHTGGLKLWRLEEARSSGGLEERALEAGDPGGLKEALEMEGSVGLDEGALVATVESGHVFCCALDYPLAATTGLGISLGVALWDMEKGNLLRRLNPTLSMWVVQVQGHHLVASMGSSSSPSIFIYDLRELANTNLATDKLWSRQLECQPNHEPHFFCNKSRLFINQKDGFKILDFWNVVDEKPGPFKKYFISGIKSAFRALLKGKLSNERFLPSNAF